MIARLIAILLSAPVLGGCWEAMKSSVAGGESKVFERPPYAVRGKTPYDQNWVDRQIEGGVAAFGWDRPAPRPPELDAPAGVRSKAAIPAKKKLGIFKRIKDRVAPAPIEPTPFIMQQPVAVPPAPPPKPRDPVDELLGIRR